MKKLLPLIALVLLSCSSAKAMTSIVYDPTNYAENLLAAQEAVKQTANMVEQLKTQIQQYERMLKDALSLPDFVTGDLANQIGQLEKFKNDLAQMLVKALGGYSSGGGIAEVVREFYAPSDFKSNPTLFAQRDSLGTVGQSESLGYELTKRYADSVMESLQRQGEGSKDFNTRYTKVLDAGKSAEGQMQVMLAQLEMLSLVVEKLGDIQELLYLSSGMQAAQSEALVQKEARERVMRAIITGESAYFNDELAAPVGEYKYFE